MIDRRTLIADIEACVFIFFCFFFFARLLPTCLPANSINHPVSVIAAISTATKAAPRWGDSKVAPSIPFGHDLGYPFVYRFLRFRAADALGLGTRSTEKPRVTCWSSGLCFVPLDSILRGWFGSFG